jgi:TonB family protein
VKIKPSAGEPSELVGLSRHDDWSLFEFTSIKLNRQQIEDLLSSAIVEVTIGDQPTALVKLDGSGALPKLHECWRMQVTRYGLDPKLAETVSRWPEPNAPTISLFTPDDYPPDAMDNNDQGSVEIRIDVDATGTKLDCKVVKSSGHASLDAKTCTVAMERGTFRPALDRTGKPIAAPYVTAVNWRLTAR